MLVLITYDVNTEDAAGRKRLRRKQVVFDRFRINALRFR